ncbi:MAG: hypothetical protein Q8R60_18190 [Mycobacteriales bacterium]|nr:hypothetical protein [Mycobacteriales bacterium]
MNLRRVLLPLLVLLAAGTAPAAAAGSRLDPKHPRTAYEAELRGSDACAGPTETCHVQELTVVARPGTLVTIDVAQEQTVLEVLDSSGAEVARDGQRPSDELLGGPGEQTEQDGDAAPDVTFEHRSASATYRVRVSVTYGALGGDGFRTAVSARLGGRALDRDPVCDDAVVVPATSFAGDGVLAAHVRVVVPPELANDMRAAAPVAVEAYRRIGVSLRLSYDVTSLPAGVRQADELRGWARARYGGRRPAGVDAVYVANDVFGGGQADCLAGTLHPEQGFSIGQVHYSPENTVPGGVGTVSAGVILAHEVGHSFGGHHEQGNCAEGAPPQADHGTSPESRGPCTIMSPAALTLGRTFGTLEGATIRSVLARRAR